MPSNKLSVIISSIKKVDVKDYKHWVGHIMPKCKKNMKEIL